MNRLPCRLFLPALSCLLLAAFTQFVPAARSQANVTGQWQTLSNTMPINPIHVALMRSGKVLVVSGSGNDQFNTVFSSAIWDPQTGTITTQTLTWDMFCNGMVNLPDGRPLVFGGTYLYDPFKGAANASAYDPDTNLFTDLQSMAHGRWYPTGLVLGDGSVMVIGGMDENATTNLQLEYYKLGVGWSAPISLPWTPPLYPRTHLLPNGNVFISGSSPTSRLFTPSTNTWNLNYAATKYGQTRMYGSSVLLPLTPANGYKPKVMIFGGGNPSTATTELIDLSIATPAWVYGPNMSQPRIEMDATLLPNGKVLANGGSLNDEDTTTASLNADLYDPVSNTFSPAGTEAFARLYHCVTLLLPDATVWVAGGNPKRRTYEPHMEIYSPPYLFNADGSLATRPTITNASFSPIGYGSSFQVQTPDASNISTVVLMRNGSSTHAFDMDQRYVGLSFTAASGALNVTGPPTANIAPPGYYMLFILNNAGVPSVAKIVQISPAPTDQPPVGTITSPSSDPTIVVGQSISYAGTGSDADGTISAYSWNFPGGVPTTSNLANPGSVTYSNTGTYITSLTVTDNQGTTDPKPPTRTVTVTSGPNFSISIPTASQSIIQGGSASYTATVTPASGFTGNVVLSVTGLPTGATASFNPTSITTSGSSTLTVATLGSTPAGGYTLTVTGTSGTLTHTATASLIVAQSNGGSTIDFHSGFSTAGMQFNGSTSLSGASLRLTNATAGNQAGSAFWTTPINIRSFANDFTFQQNTNADGFTFTIQSAGPTALGPAGGALGFAGIASSVAVKFDLFDNSGEGNNSTGLYTKGAPPKTPATTLGGGVNLHNGDIFQVHMTYNGATLTVTITDTVIPENTFTTSWPINIASTVGTTTAYVGFTGSTGGTAATQDILTWTYSSGTTQSPAATPTIAPATGTYTSSQTVSMTDASSGATIYYTLDGTTPTTSSSRYTASFPVNSTTTVKAIATASGFSQSATATSVITINSGSGPTVNFGTGFTAMGMQFNGHTKLNGTRLQLTDTTITNESASAFWTTPVNIQSFTNDFIFQLTNPNSDGFTFAIQNASPTALGSPGGALGYAGIASSVAVKFDLFDNAGEGNNSTGLYTKGASPKTPATTLGGGVNLHSGDTFQVHMTYNGTTLTMTITDSVVPADTFTISWPVNIPTVVGGNTAYVGFTGSTGSTMATQEILTWTYNSGSTASPAATPTFSPPAGSYTAAQNVSISDTTPNAAIFYTTDGTTPATTAGGSTSQYSSPIAVASTTTINAMATASGFSTSTMASATYTINVPTPDFSISVGPSTQSVAAGGNTSYTVTITPANGFTGTVSFGVTGLPTGGTSSFNPTTIAGSGSNTMTISTTTASPAGTYTLTVTATSGSLSHLTTTSVVVTQTTSPTVNFSGGFTATGMQFNGHTKLNGARLQLTDTTTTNQAASAFWATPVNVQSFTNDFTFQLTNPNADGFTFTIQAVGPTAIGPAGGALGYAGIGSSLAVKFDLFDNAGEGNNSTGLYTKGAAPKTPATTLGGGVNLHSGDPFQVHLTYNGTTLTMTITDTVVPADTFTTSWTVNIPTTVGANTAYVGFTGGTGGSTATQEILGWTFGPSN